MGGVNGRIGCRDESTAKLLRELGFDAYFSSCLTTTLYYQFGRLSFEGREGVIFCDANVDELFPLNHFYQFSRVFKRKSIEKVLGRILSGYKNEPREVVSHSCLISASHKDRFALSLDLLKKYARAKLVITSRIHCALPCVAMGTPVILLVTKYDRLRYPGIDRFLNKIYFTSSGELVVDVNVRNEVVFNNDKHIPYAEKMVLECESFVESLH